MNDHRQASAPGASLGQPLPELAWCFPVSDMFTASPDLSILSASIPDLSMAPERRDSPATVLLEFVSITAGPCHLRLHFSSLFLIPSPVVSSGGEQTTQSPWGSGVLPTMLVSRGWKTSSAPL